MPKQAKETNRSDCRIPPERNPSEVTLFLRTSNQSLRRDKAAQISQSICKETTGARDLDENWQHSSSLACKGLGNGNFPDYELFAENVRQSINH
jgi:hypothetical protein